MHEYWNIKLLRKKKKEKKLFTDKNIGCKNSLHFDNKIAYSKYWNIKLLRKKKKNYLQIKTKVIKTAYILIIK